MFQTSLLYLFLKKNLPLFAHTPMPIVTLDIGLQILSQVYLGHDPVSVKPTLLLMNDIGQGAQQQILYTALII